MASELSSAVVFVLVRPHLEENIGTAFRAIWNCGFDDLRLVAPKHPFPSEKALKSAAGAGCKLSLIRSFGSIEEAVNDCEEVVALTARMRDMLKPVCELADMPNFFQKRSKIAFLFGPEPSGLTSAEVSFAKTMMTIDLNPQYSSLNLAQAVLMVAYSCMKCLKETNALPVMTLAKQNWEGASQNNILGMVKHLENLLSQTNFFYPPHMALTMKTNLRNMLTRLTWTDQEVRSFRGIISHFEKISGQRT